MVGGIPMSQRVMVVLEGICILSIPTGVIVAYFFGKPEGCWLALAGFIFAHGLRFIREDLPRM